MRKRDEYNIKDIENIFSFSPSASTGVGTAINIRETAAVMIAFPKFASPAVDIFNIESWPFLETR